MLLLALIGTYLYNDQEVLTHIRAYFRDVGRIGSKDYEKSYGRHPESSDCGNPGLCRFALVLLMGLQLPADRSQYRVPGREEQGNVAWNGLDLLMILLAGILFLVSMILSSAVTFLQGYQGQIPVPIGPTIQWILKYLLPFFLTVGMFFLIYKIIPNKVVHFKSALQASLFAGLLWELAKHLFAWYVVYLAEYSIFYGSLSTVVIFVLWVYYSSTILILGGEFVYFFGRRSTKLNGLTKSPKTGG